MPVTKNSDTFAVQPDALIARLKADRDFIASTERLTEYHEGVIIGLSRAIAVILSEVGTERDAAG